MTGLMIFTNTDPRYAGRFDDKQGGDTMVTMERVREAIAFNAEFASSQIRIKPESASLNLLN